MYNLLRRLSGGTLPTWLVGVRDVTSARALADLGLISVQSAEEEWPKAPASIKVTALTRTGWATVEAMAHDFDPDSAPQRYAVGPGGPGSTLLGSAVTPAVNVVPPGPPGEPSK